MGGIYHSMLAWKKQDPFWKYPGELWLCLIGSLGWFSVQRGSFLSLFLQPGCFINIHSTVAQCGLKNGWGKGEGARQQQGWGIRNTKFLLLLDNVPVHTVLIGDPCLHLSQLMDWTPFSAFLSSKSLTQQGISSDCGCCHPLSFFSPLMLPLFCQSWSASSGANNFGK